MKIDDNVFKDNKIYGSATIGSKGQVVIPAEARKDLELKPGDRLLVLGKMGKALGLIKADKIGEMMSIAMDMSSSPEEKKIIEKYIKQLMRYI